MESNAQFDVYAAFYNLLYKDKNYKAEADYIDALISRYARLPSTEVELLDLACGTGRHLQELSKKGYKHLSGSDISKAMIDVATETSASAGFDVQYYNHSFQNSNRIERKFDVVLSMFSAVNYITNFEDQSLTLRNIRNLLKPDGIFAFDYWNGNAVVESYSPVKVLRKKDGDAEIMRISETSIDLIKQDATVKFTCMFTKNEQRHDEFTEVHHLHYYYFSEMLNLLKSHQFEVVHMSPFMHIDKEVAPKEWNISIVAKRIS
ncbi:MAG TPA: class I SAM-dependent methyltransferase [Chryseolinea sp.]|nr:class I SAM-dependent methyltransferase [Chryseolinea sp.]